MDTEHHQVIVEPMDRRHLTALILLGVVIVAAFLGGTLAAGIGWGLIALAVASLPVAYLLGSE